MSFVKYVLKTGWKTKKADWAEYRKIRKDVIVARTDMANARLAVTRDFGQVVDDGEYSNMCRTPACIRTYSIFAPTVPDYSCVASAPDFVPMERSCGKFVSDKRCQNYNCSMVYRNHLYMAECDKYNALIKLRNEFWDKKFANVK